MNDPNDRLAVRDTVERFHDAVNQRKPAEIAALFTETGVWEVAPPFAHRFEGRRAIEAGITGTIGQTEVLVQACGPIVIDLVDATHARARTSMQEFGRFHDGSAMHIAGTYHDALERQPDGAWRFAQRRFVAHYADDLRVPGKALLGASERASIAPTPPHADAAEQRAVAAVVSRFASLIEAHDYVGASELFAEDAVWSSSAGALGFRQEGRAQIRGFLIDSPSHAEAVYYAAAPPLITLLGDDRAESRVAIIEVLHVKATNERKLLLATYVDELVKTRGAWLFRKREATVRHIEPLHGGK